jgi:tetratricopeptide (TPR) repeat protein
MLENPIHTNEELISLNDLMHRADLQLANGFSSEAEQVYRAILIKNPRNHRAALGIALAALQQDKMAEAIQFMQQAVEMAPGITQYRRNVGELLRRVGKLEAAISSHTITTNMEPHSAENHFLLGLAYNDNRQFSLAIHHYYTALSYNKNDGLTWNNLGASLESMGDKQTAKVAYEKAIALNSQHAEAQNNLAAIYSEEGRLDEARIHFAAAISANPEFVDAHYNLSLIKTYTLDDPHLSFLESIATKINQYSIHNRIRYYFALGKALDDTKQYARAFQAYARGNQLHYLQQPWDKTKLQELVTQIPEIFSNKFLKRPPTMQSARCPIFIVGMPRAGTTLIEQILASHKDIYGAGELTILGEIIQEACHAANMPFTTWIAQLTDQQFSILGEQYLDRTWKLAPDKNFIVDKMPGNCFYIGMIYRMLPNAKIIHAMRDPMDSCFSCFTHLFKDTMLFAYDQTTLGTYYTLYAKAMQHWHTVLPENTIFNLSYEQMIANHETLSKQLVDYLGLPWDPNCLHFYENNRPVKTASLTQVRKPIYKTSLQRWHHFANELSPLLKIVTPYRNIKRISI